MEKDQQFFTPQHVDEQIEQRAMGPEITPEARLLQDLQGVAQQIDEEDQRALQRTWVRLQQKSSEYAHSSHHWREKTMQEKPFISPQTLSSSPSIEERKPRGIKRQAAIAFAVAVVLVELFTWIWLSQTTWHPGTHAGSRLAATATTTPAATPTSAASPSKPLCTFQDHNSQLGNYNIEHSLSWSLDGKLTTTAWNVRTLDAQTCRQVASLTSAQATDAYWSPNGTRLLVIWKNAQILDQQGTVLVTHTVTPASVANNATSLATAPLVSLSGSGNDVEVSAWSPNGLQVASVYTIGISYGVEIWSATTGLHQRSLPCPYNDAYGIQSVTWSPDSAYLAAVAPDSSGGSNGVCVWNTSTGEMVAHLTGIANQVSFSADSKDLALSSGNSVQIYSLASRSVIHTFSPQGAQSPFLVAWSPNGSYLAVAAGQDLYILDANTGAIQATYQIAQNLYMEHLAWSPDSTMIAEQAYLSENPAAFVSVWHVQAEG